jgi:hypothetical protein
MAPQVAVVAVTDRQWFDHFRPQDERVGVDEVNFWQHAAQRHLRAIPVGGPFFFRPKAPWNAIAGFGEKNGDPDFTRFAARIRRLRSYLTPGGAVVAREAHFSMKDAAAVASIEIQLCWVVRRTFSGHPGNSWRNAREPTSAPRTGLDRILIQGRDDLDDIGRTSMLGTGVTRRS